MKLQGIGIGRGLVIGPVMRMPDHLPEPTDAPSLLSIAEEKRRVAASLSGSAEQIRTRGERVGGVAERILEAQALMIEDPMLSNDVMARLESGITAERAVTDAFVDFRDTLTGLGGYMAERATDLDDLSHRVVAHLRGVSAPGVPDSKQPFVLVARDLAPADTASLDLAKVLAIVTSEGGPTSHTAILARERSVLAVVGVAGAFDAVSDAEIVIVDASSGSITVTPTSAQVTEAEAAIMDQVDQADGSLAPGALADGTVIPLLANLGSVDGVADALAKGAEGVGLFRTEFLFLGATRAPTIDEQQTHYATLFAAFAGRKVVVRVLDAGADKQLAFLGAANEQNPALGLRGLRALRANERILYDQLTALSRAAAISDADVRVMAPMVATVEETQYFTQLAHKVGLRSAGIMIEIPSAALLADCILPETDFASIGTNDLTQYSLAADRMLGSVASYQDPWHPSVLRLIAQVGTAGTQLGKPVGVCGEAAADPLLAVVLVGLGVSSLSMAPAALAEVRTELARYSLEQAKSFAKLALAQPGAREAQSAVRDLARELREDALAS